MRDTFTFSQKSRSGILLASIKDANAKKIARLPDSLLQKEESLIGQITKLENSLFEELNKGVRARKDVISQLRDNLFNLKNLYSNHISLLENNYKDYYQLKYDTYTATVSDVQNNLFQKLNSKDKKSDRLIEYFIGERYIYRFEISPDKYDFVISNKPKGFERLVNGLKTV